ncbi:ATP-binding cassette sub-family C member 10 [Bacillus rossius redtenbacheri]|uniref:ATP-binding cassette sub-family C member 10 n=1 Tax=Bacillus rossius redtenbacheri TaxID=93214 RepID=UPI002FDC90DB
MEASPKQWDWKEMCGAEGFVLWSPARRDLGVCFQQLCLQVPALALLAFLSSYFTGSRSYWIHATRRRHAWALVCRGLAAFLLAVAPILKVCLATAIAPGSLNPVDYLACAVETMAWLVHLCYVLTLRSRVRGTLRGPAAACAVWAVTFALAAVSARTHYLAYAGNQDPDLELFTAQCYGFSILTMALQAAYLVTMIPNDPILDVEEEEIRIQVSEAQALLAAGASRLGTYSRFREDRDPRYLGVAKEGATLLSRLLLHWVTPLVRKGAEAQLTGTDELHDLPLEMSPAHLCARLEAAMGEAPGRPSPAREDVSVRSRPASLLRALHSCFWLQFYGIGALKLLADCAGFAGPLLLNRLVSFVETRGERLRDGYLCAAGLFAATLLSSLCLTHFNLLMAEVGLKIRAAIVTTVYRKTVSVSASSLAKFSVGEVMNFMSTDTDRIMNACPSFHSVWSIPFQIAVTLYLLYSQVGLAFLAGVGFSIILIPINKFIADKIGRLSTSMMERKDERVKVVAEMLRGIRVIKFHVWEEYFIEKVDRLRAMELRYLGGRKYLDAVCVFFWATTPVLVSILTFTTYVLWGNTLTAATVFTSIALLNMLIAPLNAFPWVLNGLTEAWVSIKRIQRLLELPDLDLSHYYSPVPADDSELVLFVKDGTFSYGSTVSSGEEHGASITLTRINITLKKGELLGVMGRVGSGKTSLLLAMLAELDQVSGVVGLSDPDAGVGLVSQQAWLQRGTIRDNILFGKPYDRAKYKSVIDACCLQPDIDALPDGDLTGVGDSGSTLSGGQKIRICLARAVYQDKKIYFLDDILSAVDVHVARHIFQKCVRGLLRSKTCVLCTHHVQYLLSADNVVVMEDGRIQQQGKPNVVLANFDEYLLLENVAGIAATVSKGKDVGSGPTAEDSAGRGTDAPEGRDGVLEEEGRETGTIGAGVLWSYWRAVGHLLAAAILLSLASMQATRNFTDWWLSYWVSHVNNSSNATNATSVPLYAWTMSPVDDRTQFYLTVYGIMAGLNSLFTLLRAFLFAYGGLHAAAGIHNLLLKNIVSARVLFFDTSPLGRILNRFSSDTYTIDDSLPFIANILLAQLFSALGAVAIVVYGLPWMVLVLAPLVPVYQWLQAQYRLASRELKRLSSVSLSPVYSHFSETLAGLPTIRAFRATPRFRRENEDYLEANQKCQYASQAAGQWLGLRLQFIGVAMVTGIGFIAMLQHQFNVANPGLIGLAISYALSVTSILNGLVNAFTETEKEMVAVERVCQYTEEVVPERSEELALPPYGWPGQGVVTFHEVVLKYRDHLVPSLRCVSFETRPAEKIGVVGRTGAGKSSLLAALFRLCEVDSGEIYIDTVNISHLSLTALRSRLAIIPQEPFLFSGSVRDNVDPLGESRDAELWDALTRCQAAAAVRRLGGLGAAVGPGGARLSAGQRQLLCLARAVLRNAKIVCIDEATASVDQETDRHIQRTLRSLFRQSTVITIAHRVQTIMDSDRVLVMGEGKVLEFDSPATLLQDSRSQFHRLASREVQ